MINSATPLAPGAVIFDLEDSIAEHEKDAARELVREAVTFFSDAPFIKSIRINPFGTSYWKDDLEALKYTPIDAVLLPKSTLESVKATKEILQRFDRPVNLWLLIETPKGILELRQMCLSSSSIGAVMLGGEDLCFELELPKTETRTELFYARNHLVMCAGEIGVPAVDTPYTNSEDSDGFVRDALVAKGLGFRGKLLIHPNQIKACHEIWRPTEQEILWARSVIEASQLAEEDGKGVFRLAGEMIDRPIIQRAKRIIENCGD